MERTPEKIDLTDVPEPARRALVLGGGGSAGNAWLIGVLAGLLDAGLDPTEADLVVGTSAGATAAAQIAGTTLPELYRAACAPPPAQRRPVGAERPRGPVGDLLAQTQRIIDGAADAAGMRRGVGALLAALATDGGSERWRGTVAARLPSAVWPATRTLLTAVDADTGEPVVLDRDGELDLIDAVAASTAGAAAYRAGQRRYIDGGYRRNENADLAAGAARVLVLAPLGGRTRHPPAWGMQLGAQVDELRASGSRVDVVLPDADSREAFGPDMMDLARRAPSARAGFVQGQALAPGLLPLWHGR